MPWNPHECLILRFLIFTCAPKYAPADVNLPVSDRNAPPQITQVAKPPVPKLRFSNTYPIQPP